MACSHFTPHDELQLFLLLARRHGVALSPLAARLPASILLVAGGLALGFVPGLPHLAAAA